MSTRCNIHFVGQFETINVYRHSDGYPAKKPGAPGVDTDLRAFFAEVVRQVQSQDVRWGDAEMTAARFIVWSWRQFTDKYREGRYLDGLHPATPCVQDHGDIEYLWIVDGTKLDASGYPTISIEGEDEPCEECDGTGKRHARVR